jgi:hypothetical protein
MGAESLRQKQSRFALLASQLIQHAYELGYEVTLGHAGRCQDCPTGSEVSLHKKRLAIDLNLFKDGVWLQKTSDHFRLGKYWESLDIDCRWGGKWNDGNHYEITEV